MYKYVYFVNTCMYKIIQNIRQKTKNERFVVLMSLFSSGSITINWINNSLVEVCNIINNISKTIKYNQYTHIIEHHFTSTNKSFILLHYFLNTLSIHTIHTSLFYLVSYFLKISGSMALLVERNEEID